MTIEEAMELLAVLAADFERLSGEMKAIAIRESSRYAEGKCVAYGEAERRVRDRITELAQSHSLSR